LEQTVAVATGIYEMEFPVTEHCIYVHLVQHLLLHIYKWNHCRNFHAFTSERWVGYFIRFVTNQTYPYENLLNAHSLAQLHLRIPADIRDRLKTFLLARHFTAKDSAFMGEHVLVDDVDSDDSDEDADSRKVRFVNVC
jgi:hypothetical protein